MLQTVLFSSCEFVMNLVVLRIPTTHIQIKQAESDRTQKSSDGVELVRDRSIVTVVFERSHVKHPSTRFNYHVI